MMPFLHFKIISLLSQKVIHQLVQCSKRPWLRRFQIASHVYHLLSWEFAASPALNVQVKSFRNCFPSLQEGDHRISYCYNRIEYHLLNRNNAAHCTTKAGNYSFSGILIGQMVFSKTFQFRRVCILFIELKGGVTPEFINHQYYCFYRTLALVKTHLVVYFETDSWCCRLEVVRSVCAFCKLTVGSFPTFSLSQSQHVESGTLLSPSGRTSGSVWRVTQGRSWWWWWLISVYLCLSVANHHQLVCDGSDWRCWASVFVKGAGSHLSAERETPGETTEQVPDCWMSECLSPILASCCARWWGWWWW